MHHWSTQTATRGCNLKEAHPGIATNRKRPRTSFKSFARVLLVQVTTQLDTSRFSLKFNEDTRFAAPSSPCSTPIRPGRHTWVWGWQVHNPAASTWGRFGPCHERRHQGYGRTSSSARPNTRVAGPGQSTFPRCNKHKLRGELAQVLITALFVLSQ